MRIVSSLVAIALVAYSRGVRGEPAPSITVVRTAGAERCPEAGSIGSVVEQIRGGSQPEQRSAYQVTFARTAGGFSAAIQHDQAAGSVRTLEHDGASCAPLGRAVALTIALLMDSDAQHPKEIEPPPPAALAPPPAVMELELGPPPRPPKLGKLVSVGGAGLVGVLGPITPGLVAEFGFTLASQIRLGAGLWAGFPHKVSFGPGTVREDLGALHARACLPVWMRDGLRLDGCSGAFIGAVGAESEGYTRNEWRSSLWLAIPFEVAMVGWSRVPWEGPDSLGWEVVITGVLPLRRPDYTIDGVGTVYQSPAVGALISVRLLMADFY